MPPKGTHDTTIIVLDIGKSVSLLSVGEDTSFFDKSRRCVSWILQRRLISESQDLLSILLMGSNEADNLLGYKNIINKFDFQFASWDMLKFIENEVRSTNQMSDWIGALVVAMDMFKSQEEAQDIHNKRIVFFSDFTYPITDGMDTIVKNIKAMNIEIAVIGPDCLSDIISSGVSGEPSAKRLKQNEMKSQDRIAGEKVVYDMWCELGDLMRICTFEVALKQLTSYPRKPVRPTPWNCNLDIGNLEVKISCFKKTETKAPRKTKTKAAKPFDPNEPSTSAAALREGGDHQASDVVRDTVMHYKRQIESSNEQEEVAVQKEDVIEGYTYGTTLVPFSEEDKNILSYKPGPKCLSVVCFTAMKNVPHSYLTGDSVYIVVPRDGDKNAEVALSALVQAMKETGVLAIARRVTSNDRGLRLGILYPLVEEIESDENGEPVFKECLLFIEVAFSEDLRSVNFPSLEHVVKTITPKQFQVVDKLIDDMDLMNADCGIDGEPCEALEPSTLHEFKNQFYQHCVVQRALYPEKPIPTEIPDYIKNFVSLPNNFVDKSKSLGTELKDIFPMKPKTKFVPQESNVNVFGDFEKQVKEQSSSKILVKETVSLKKSGITSSLGIRGDKQDDFITASNELSSVLSGFEQLFKDDTFPSPSDFDSALWRYLSDGVDKKEVIFGLREILMNIRIKCTFCDAEEYNSWLRLIRRTFINRGDTGTDIWKLFCSGPITSEESDGSSLTEQDALDFINCYDPSIMNGVGKRPRTPKPPFGSISNSVES